MKQELKKPNFTPQFLFFFSQRVRKQFVKILKISKPVEKQFVCPLWKVPITSCPKVTTEIKGNTLLYLLPCFFYCLCALC